MKAALLVVLFAVGIQCQGSPRIQHFAPHALVPGRSTTLTFSGSGIGEMTNLWLSCGGETRRLESTNSNLVRFEVKCPKVPNGVYALQLSGNEGASDYQLVMVDDLATQAHNNSHQSGSSAVRLNVPAALDCILKSEQSDYYSFTAGAGERLSIEVIAHRVGSDADPVARVLDSGGRELAFCDDEPGVWRDARFVFSAPVATNYLLEVHDAAFGGGSNFDYRLRITREPLVWFTFPLVDPTEALIPFEEIGSIAAARSPADPPGKPGLGEWPSVAESEAKPRKIALPVVINGRIHDGQDVDNYQFHAPKDEQLVFQSQTRSLGSPCDLVLAIKTKEGKVLAASEPNSPLDAAITNRFAESGDYQLEVRELSGNALANVPYRIKASPFRKGVNATTESNQLAVSPGGSVNAKLNLVRHNYNGPVTVELDPKIEGITLEGNEIAESKKDAEVKIKASAGLQPGQLYHFKLKLIVPDGSTEWVSTQPALRKSFPLMLQAPESLRSLISLAVKRE